MTGTGRVSPTLGPVGAADSGVVLGEAELRAYARQRLAQFGRRYYSFAIGAAFLVMLANFFPTSVSPTHPGFTGFAAATGSPQLGGPGAGASANGPSAGTSGIGPGSSFGGGAPGGGVGLGMFPTNPFAGPGPGFGPAGSLGRNFGLGSPAVSTTVLVTQSSWYWSGQVTDVGGTGVAPPTPLTDPTVPAGDLAVAGPGQNGQPSKESYLQFDVSAIPWGSTIITFTITLPVDANGTNVNSPGTAAPIIACTANGNWAGGRGAQSFAVKPKDTCATNAPKVTTLDGGKTYTADIAAIAQIWVMAGGHNFGVAIRDDPQNALTAYQEVFGPAAAIGRLTASVTYSPPPAGSSSAGGT